MAPKPKPKKKEGTEQRRARQEMEALVAAEAEAERQSAARRALVGRAQREAALAAVNSRALEATWLQRMRAAKLEELQAEAGMLSKEHDAAVDRRDRLIEALMEDVAAANTQHSAAAAAHAEVLDQLLELHGGCMQALHRQFTGDLAAVQGKFESEKAEAAALHHRQKKELGDIMAALAASYAETRAEAAASYRLMEEEVRNRASEGLNVAKLSLEGRIRELQGAVETQHQSYVEATGEQEAVYTELAAADAAAAEAIEHRTARLRQLQETLVQWRGRIVANSGEWGRRNAALAREKELVLGHHTALKQALARFRTAQEARLKQMSVAYATVEASLKEQLATAQRIIRLAHLSGKLMLPGEAAGEGASAAGAQEVDQQPEAVAAEAEGEKEQAQGSSDGAVLQELGVPPGSAGQRLLEAFLKRMNGAALDLAALEHERLRLGAENATLRAVVAAVQAGTSVGPNAVDDPLNSLLIVNARLQKELGGAAAARKALACTKPAAASR